MSHDRFRVLVVEDNASVRAALAQQLREAGYDVQEACDGEDALLRLSEREHDLVLTDYRMPGIDGLQLLKVLKAWWPATPVVFLSAEPSGCHGEALEHGAFAWLAKPCDHGVMLQTLRAALEEAGVVQVEDPSG